MECVGSSLATSDALERIKRGHLTWTRRELSTLSPHMSTTTSNQSKILEIVSFGHRNGPLTPTPALSYDVRNIPNPPREFRHQQRASNDSTAVRQWLLLNPIFLARIEEAHQGIMSLIDEIDASHPPGKYFATVGVNCHLGRHRSVTFATELARRVKEELGLHSSWEIRVRHRDLERRSSK